MKNYLDILCEIEKFTNCNLECSIDEVESEKPFWKRKLYSEEEIKTIISELTLTNYRGNPDGYINAKLLRKRLLGDEE